MTELTGKTGELKRYEITEKEEDGFCFQERVYCDEGKNVSYLDAQDVLAERDAEIARLRKALEEIVEIDASIMDCPCCDVAAKALEGKE